MGKWNGDGANLENVYVHKIITCRFTYMYKWTHVSTCISTSIIMSMFWLLAYSAVAHPNVCALVSARPEHLMDVLVEVEAGVGGSSDPSSCSCDCKTQHTRAGLAPQQASEPLKLLKPMNLLNLLQTMQRRRTSHWVLAPMQPSVAFNAKNMI